MLLIIVLCHYIKLLDFALSSTNFIFSVNVKIFSILDLNWCDSKDISYQEGIAATISKSTYSCYAKTLLIEEDYANHFITHWPKSRNIGWVLDLSALFVYLNIGASIMI